MGIESEQPTDQPTDRQLKREITIPPQLERLPDDVIAGLSDTPVGEGVAGSVAGSVASIGIGDKNPNKITFSDDDDDDSDQSFGEDSGYSETSAFSRKPAKLLAANLHKLK